MFRLSWPTRRLVTSLVVCVHLAASVDGAAAACLGTTAAAEPWRGATTFDATGRAAARFIPPELYSGAPWNGDRAMQLRPMSVTRKPQHPHDHPPITITAPHPAPDRPDLATLHRTRHSARKGVVSQVFRINERGDGLGRISDDRRGRSREMEECFKFPLGEWRQGEERRCRGSVIRIIELDFEHACVAHSLKFRWNDEGTYIFSPGLGLVSVDGRDE